MADASLANSLTSDIKDGRCERNPADCTTRLHACRILACWGNRQNGEPNKKDDCLFHYTSSRKPRHRRRRRPPPYSWNKIAVNKKMQL